MASMTIVAEAAWEFWRLVHGRSFQSEGDVAAVLRASRGDLHREAAADLWRHGALVLPLEVDGRVEAVVLAEDEDSARLAASLGADELRRARPELAARSLCRDKSGFIL